MMKSSPPTLVGTVTGLWRYPVKSMMAEPLTSADLSWTGVTGDRRWAFVRPDSASSGFPWHTIREHPAMCRYCPRLIDPGRPDTSPIEVRTPSGKTLSVTDPALAEELGVRLRVMKVRRGIFDTMPVSLITTSTVTSLCRLANAADQVLRFRPNLLITTVSDAPYPEDEWVGHVLRIGDAALRVDQRDSRCVVVNVDPDSGEPDAPLLKVVASHRRARAGVYGSTEHPGLVHVGDPVTITT